VNPIIFDPLHEGISPPTRATAASAGHDLAACLLGASITVFIGGVATPRAIEPSQDAGPAAGAAATRHVTLAPGEKALIPLGFRARLPEGYEAQVRPRSGTSLKTDLVIVNSPGTIDADFPDEWQVPVKNGGAAPLTIRHGERIAQMVLARYEALPFTLGRVTRSTERAGGFGSTGK
jgi:dUTP pyrophosphatase